MSHFKKNFLEDLFQSCYVVLNLGINFSKFEIKIYLFKNNYFKLVTSRFLGLLTGMGSNFEWF